MDPHANTPLSTRNNLKRRRRNSNAKSPTHDPDPTNTSPLEDHPTRRAWNPPLWLFGSTGSDEREARLKLTELRNLLGRAHNSLELGDTAATMTMVSRVLITLGDGETEQKSKVLDFEQAVRHSPTTPPPRRIAKVQNMIEKADRHFQSIEPWEGVLELRRAVHLLLET